MNRNPKHVPADDMRKKYSTELKCLSALIQFRISNDGKCFNPMCQAPVNELWYRPIRNNKDGHRKGFLCRNCLQHYFPMADSIFESSKIPLVLWFELIYKMMYSKNSVSSLEVTREFGQHTATMFYAMHKIREQMGKCLDWSFENAVVEIDESYINTGKKGYGKHFQFKRGRGSERKSNILCIAERAGRAKLFVIPSTESKSIIPVIVKEIDESCLIVTDEWGAYEALAEIKDKQGNPKYKHIVCKHNDKKDKYKQGSASTNTDEGIFSLVKRMIKGTYKNVTDKYLQNYLNEISFRYSFRNEPDYGFSIFMKSFGDLSERYKERNYGRFNFPVNGAA